MTLRSPLRNVLSAIMRSPLVMLGESIIPALAIFDRAGSAILDRAGNFITSRV